MTPLGARPQQRELVYEADGVLAVSFYGDSTFYVDSRPKDDLDEILKDLDGRRVHILIERLD